MASIEPGTTIYVSKFATTIGIAEVTARSKPAGYRGGPQYVSAFIAQKGWSESFRVGHTAFLDRAHAVADAEKRRARRIAGLEQQIAKLRAMSFEPEATS